MDFAGAAPSAARWHRLCWAHSCWLAARWTASAAANALALLSRGCDASQNPCRADAIFVKTGGLDIGGVIAGIDLALAMIEEDFGIPPARHRPKAGGVSETPRGQSQFSTVLAAQASDVEGRFSALHTWITENIAGDLKVETARRKNRNESRTSRGLYDRTE